MHKRLDWKLILEVLAKLVLFFAFFRIIIPYIFPIGFIIFNSKYKTNSYEFLLSQSIPIISCCIEDDEEDINLISIVLKSFIGIDISDYRSILNVSIPVMGQIEEQILAIKEDGPVVIIPRVAQNTEDKENASSASEGLNIKERKENPPKKRNLDPTKPLILIYHTHTTEAYNPDGKGSNFTVDPNYNMIRVGEELKKELEEKYGISVIHDTTFHDVPKREGAYLKSRPTVQRYLKKYNSFKIIVDLHRDANVSRNKSTAVIGSERYARIMFVVDTLHKNYTKNNVLVSKINDKFNYLYPGFSRGIMYKKSKIHYNQDLASNIILIEVGSNENSLEEALNSAKIIARVLAECIE
ncbi:stage II sporulation protein P [Caloramator fervidus]|nr:stage II sporulation protein P [Caloramator fervidus]